MNLLYHAPYVLQDVLLFLAAGLPLVLWPAIRRRDWRQVRWYAQIFGGMALWIFGGMASTATQPNAQAANTAQIMGLALLAAGTIAMTAAIVERRYWKRRQVVDLGKEPQQEIQQDGVWPPPPIVPPSP